MFLQNAAWPAAYGSPCGPRPWVRPLESVDAIGASLVAAQQSAPAWTCFTPAGSARRDVRRQGIGNVWDAGGAVGGGNAAGIDPNLGKS